MEEANGFGRVVTPPGVICRGRPRLQNRSSKAKQAALGSINSLRI